MSKQVELDWVGYVLHDVISFLAENEMMQSAQMLAVAAAHIEHDMKKRDTTAPDVRREPTSTNVVAFPARIPFLN